MKLIYKVTLRLAIVLLPVIALWAVVFYYTMVEEINDESDDSLVEYAELIIRRQLAGVPLPEQNNGSNNSYTIVQIDKNDISEPYMTFHDEMVYIPEQQDTEPARVLTTVFMDDNDCMYRLTVAMPTFERDDLLSAILWYVLALYLLLVVTTLTVTTIVFYRSMRPLYALLAWFDKYTPGRVVQAVPSDSSVPEFRKLGNAAQLAVNRAEDYFQQQKQFIGNASHELQTPLAVIGNRIEWLMDKTVLTEEQHVELSKMRQSLSSLVKLNRTLLLLTKIDNGQFPETVSVDIVALLHDELGVYEEIHAHRNITCIVELPERFIVNMNESLAMTLLTNLLKNAFQHSADGATIKVNVHNGNLYIQNSGSSPLEKERIFDRFYHGGNSNSTGLGLALVSSICRNCSFGIDYDYCEGFHCFTVKFR